MAADPLHQEIVTHHDKVLIVDFGSQVTQLIARRVREAGVYCEIAPFQKADAAFAELKPKAVIFSGGPASVLEEGSPRAPQAIFDSGVPILGICYGEQVIAAQLGGEVTAGDNREFGRAEVEIISDSPFFDGVWQKGRRYPVWMSHGDAVSRLPQGFTRLATSEHAPIAVIADEARRYYAVQFHLEVVHTPDGAKLLANFVHKVAGLKSDWTMHAFRAEAVKTIRAQVGQGGVLCALSGGVDSSVAALLIHEAIGDRLTCVFVDHGLLRQ
ncbi:MAG: glutamine-hydrolyzing GMP synthase, partial [Methylovirgula sp.]